MASVEGVSCVTEKWTPLIDEVWERNQDASDAKASKAVERRTEMFIQHLGKGKTSGPFQEVGSFS